MKNYKNYLFIALGIVIAAITILLTNAAAGIKEQQVRETEISNDNGKPIPIIASSPIPVIGTTVKQIWEYKEVIFDYEPIKEKSNDSGGGSKLLKTLDEFGMQGWELVSISPVPHYQFGRLEPMQRCIAVLKRPKMP